MIRQAISCDICGTDMQQTNHWFVAFDHDGQLRLAGWNAKGRLRKGAKHLCGQTCLHKMLDEFITRIPAARTSTQENQPAQSLKAKTPAARPADTRLAPSLPDAQPLDTASVLHTRKDSSDSPAILLPHPGVTGESAPDPATSTPHNPRVWRSEAWKRELERTKGYSAPQRRRSIA